jgi:hypothetical protein
MSEKTIDTGAFLERLVALRAAHRNEIDAIIDEIRPWQTREYGWDTAHGTHKDIAIQPGESVAFEFGAITVVPGTEVVGLPESTQTTFGVDKFFHMQGLVIDEDVAPHFNVGALTGGARLAWRASMPVPAIRFASSATPAVKLDVPVNERCTIALTVTNISDKPQMFRAKIIGRERADLPKAEA